MKNPQNGQETKVDRNRIALFAKVDPFELVPSLLESTELSADLGKQESPGLVAFQHELTTGFVDRGHRAVGKWQIRAISSTTIGITCPQRIPTTIQSTTTTTTLVASFVATREAFECACQSTLSVQIWPKGSRVVSTRQFDSRVGLSERFASTLGVHHCTQSNRSKLFPSFYITSKTRSLVTLS